MDDPYRDLGPEVRRGLRPLPKPVAERVAAHLREAQHVLDEDPAAAYEHTARARRLASRIGVVREACGLAAYRAGMWAEALSEFRAVRRIEGTNIYLPLMADCERGLGRPERALDIARSAEARQLNRAAKIEMRIVESGARRDLKQYDAAVVALQGPHLESRRREPWSARLFYAYADALVDAGRMVEAREWFERAAAIDEQGETDADERLGELEGLEITDIIEDSEETAEEPGINTQSSGEQRP